MSISIAVVCEAAADRRIGCELADRVVQRDVEWIEPEHLGHLRSYRGLRQEDEFLAWTHVHRAADRLNVTVQGPFLGGKGDPDAFITRRALVALHLSPDIPQAIILLRDADDQPERRNGMKQAVEDVRTRLKTAVPVVIGLAIAKRECWVLCGFVPQNDAERETLARVKGGDELGFDPTLQPERLKARTPGSKNDAKRVLAMLTNGDWQREVLCWQETDLDTLQERGQTTGLAAYIREVRENLVPLFRQEN